MFKRALSIIILLFFIAPFATVQASALNNELSESSVIEAIPSARTLAVKFNNELYLITVTRGCKDQLKTGANIQLSVRDHLDGKSDVLRTSTYYQCKIKTAYKINAKLRVKRIFANKRTALLNDATGNLYFVSYKNECRTITSQLNRYVYAYQYNLALATGDQLIIPGNLGNCTFRTVKKIVREVNKITVGDRTAPSTVSHVRAMPANSSIFLYFRKAKDNVKIDHYLIGISRYRINMQSLHRRQTADLPAIFTTKKNRVWMTGLRNDQTYFFYIKAVDTSGNVSSDWSLEAKARTSSAINKPAYTKNYSVNARKDGTPARK